MYWILMQRMSQLVNFAKSAMCVSPSVADQKGGRLASILGFSVIATRVWDKVNGWCDKLLSAGGKEILIKAIVQLIPTYAMSLFCLPRRLIFKVKREYSVRIGYWVGRAMEELPYTSGMNVVMNWWKFLWKMEILLKGLQLVSDMGLQPVVAETKATLVVNWITVGRRIYSDVDLSDFLESSSLPSPSQPLFNSSSLPSYPQLPVCRGRGVTLTGPTPSQTTDKRKDVVVAHSRSTIKRECSPDPTLYSISNEAPV
ncbi:hypothetical protein Dsin_007065 [Dipteronia sinensis]|uniref:Uncharacterized protein n=1 Tax=Dipteronia sinensis TaxID=43782 RepID=A0AAE0AZF3_9ROSI|nr:hypothetical protein Dsin_007065 [Dipteronia sinensis]